MSIRSAMNAVAAASVHPVTPLGVPKEVGGHLRVEPAAAVMAREAGLPVDELTLGRLVGSEVGGLPIQYFLAVAEVGVNEARARGVSITKLLTEAGPNRGFYGEQRGRWAATSRPCNKRHLEAARLALAGASGGIARGARKFYDPKVQDGGLQRGKPLKFDAIGIARKWYGEGWRWIGEVNAPDTGELLIDPYRLLLLSRTSSTTLAKLEDTIEDGRQRWAGKLPAPDAGGSRDEEGGLPWGAVAAAAALILLAS